MGGQHNLGLAIIGTIMGSLLFRLLVALVLRAGLNPNDLKLITALFVFAALILPGAIAALKLRLARSTPAPTDSISSPLPQRLLDAGD